MGREHLSHSKKPTQLVAVSVVASEIVHPSLQEGLLEIVLSYVW